MDMLSEESARDQLDLLFDWYDIDKSDIEDEDSLEAFVRSERKIIRALRKGRLEIIEDDSSNKPSLIVKQKLSFPTKGVEGDTITYYGVTGRAKTAIKDSKNMSQHKKIYQYLGGLSKLGSVPFESMEGKDLSLAESLAYFFLLV